MAFCHADYRIAWICALPLELAAARLMLDETHPDLPQSQQDNNSYSLGRIGPHYVVITCLPSGRTGTVSAAEVAGQIRWSFPQAQVGLLVGIGGGAPDQDADVRLGDVVVGHPSSSHGSVLPYDFGKTVQDGHFVLNGSVNNPPSSLLAAVSKLRANHYIEAPAFGNYAVDATTKSPAARRPDTGDILFEASYDHPDHSSADCERCDPRKVVTRKERSVLGPTVHYGLIASASQVMRHGSTRDRLRKQYGVMCFEMEAAGLMNSLPSLVIRGICDYADSHKNKQWQFYAAVVAAAYAKELLGVLPVPQQEDSSLPLIRYNNSSFKSSPSREAWELAKYSIDSWKALLNRLSDYNPSSAHRRLTVHRVSGTTDWFLSNPHYKKWCSDPSMSSGCLWCFGKVGCGKTMICTRVIDDQIAQSMANKGALAYFYCDFSHPKTLDPKYIVASLLKQLLQCMVNPQEICAKQVRNSLESFYNPGGAVPDLEDLSDILSIVFAQLHDATFVIDGLNELESKDIAGVLDIFQGLWRKRSKQRLFISSREELGHANNITFALHLPLEMESIEADIETYIESRIASKMAACQITDDLNVLKTIKRRLSEEANGMFIWVHLQIEALWRDCKTDQDILLALSDLPADLAETYWRCLERLPELTREDVPRILHWVTFATPPLLVSELKEAVAFDLECHAWDDRKFLSRSTLIGSCANLIYEDAAEHTVHLAHSSVKQFLLDTRHGSLSGFKPFSELGLLRCGELCVNYLSFDDFGLQVQALSGEKALPSPNAVVNSINLGILGKLSPFRKQGHQTYVVPGSLSPSRNITADEEKKYGLLSYARDNWALQTKMITDKSPIWEQFQTLVLQANNTWKLQPWTTGNRSRTSYLHACLAWATRERHLPVLSLLLSLEGARLLKEAINLPYAHDGLPALHSAARSGFADVVLELLEYCSVNARGPGRWTALHFAAEKNHDEVAILLLDSKTVHVTATTDSKLTALEVALSHGSDAVALRILRRSNHSDAVLKNAEFLAASCGCIGALHILIGPPNRSNSPARSGPSDAPYATVQALMYAVESGCSKATKYLLQRGEIDLKVNRFGQLLLDIAVGNADAETVQILASLEGVDADLQYHDRHSPLSSAARAGHVKVVEALLAGTDDVDMVLRKYHPWAPLICAADSGHGHVVKVLLAGVPFSPGLSFMCGGQALTKAACNKHFDVVELLLARPDVQANFKDLDGQTPLMHASRAGHERVTKLLLARPEVDAREEDDSKRTSLSLAAQAGHKEVVKLLLQSNVDPISRDVFGRDPLSYAAQAGYEDTAELLVPWYKGNLSGDTSLRTVLSYAAEAGRQRIVKLLLAQHLGADELSQSELHDLQTDFLKANFRDKTHRSPHQYAKKNGHNKIVKMLEACAKDLELEPWNIR